MRVIACGLLLTLGMPSVNAASQGEHTATDAVVPFGRIDSDHNGYVSRVEARSIVVVETHFDAADKNNDSLLDREEYRSSGGARETDQAFVAGSLCAWYGRCYYKCLPQDANRRVYG